MQAAFEKLRASSTASTTRRRWTPSRADVLRVYLGAIDHVLDVGKRGDETAGSGSAQLVKELSTAFALAVPRAETEPIAPHLAFFQRVAAMIRKRLADEGGPTVGKGRGGTDIDAAVRQVIGGAVDAGEVIDLFAAAGLDAARLDILSEDFL